MEAVFSYFLSKSWMLENDWKEQCSKIICSKIALSLRRGSSSINDDVAVDDADADDDDSVDFGLDPCWCRCHLSLILSPKMVSRNSGRSQIASLNISEMTRIFFSRKKSKLKKCFPPIWQQNHKKTLKQYLLPGYRKQHATLLLLNTFLTQRSVFNISWPLANLLQACYLATYKIAPSRQFHEWQRSATML